MNWLAKILYPIIIQEAASRIAAFIVRLIKRKKNQEVKEQLENAKTPEEFESASRAASDRLSDDA